jgi:hypothetical protein
MLRMTEIMTSQNIDFFSWNTLYIPRLLRLYILPSECFFVLYGSQNKQRGYFPEQH